MSRTDRKTFVDLYIEQRRVSVHKYLQRLEINKEVGSFWTGSLELFDPDWTFLESFILEKGFGTKIQFTYGWEGAPSPVINAVLWDYKPQFSNDGIKLILEFGSAAMSSSRVQDYVSFGEGRKISDIVKQIADANGWKTEIEPTVGSFEHPITKKGRSDFSFIKDELATRAINADGLGGFQVYIEEETLHFHTMFYNKRATNVYKSYLVYRDMDGEVVSFEPADQFGSMAFFGAGKVKVVSVDPKSKKVISGKASYTEGSSRIPVQGNKRPSIVSEKDKGKDNVVVTKPFNRQGDVDDYAKCKWAEGASNCYDATLNLIGDPLVPVFSNIEIIVLKTDQKLHYLSGVYWATRVNDEVTRDDFSTSVELTRLSSSVGSETIDRLLKKLVRPVQTQGVVMKEEQVEQG